MNKKMRKMDYALFLSPILKTINEVVDSIFRADLSSQIFLEGSSSFHLFLISPFLSAQ